MIIKFPWRRKKGKQKINDSYLLGLIQKAVPLAEMWFLEFKRCSDVKRKERIVKHLYRIRKVQLKAQAKLCEVKK